MSEATLSGYLEKTSISTLDLRDAKLSDEAREKLCWRYYERVYKPHSRDLTKQKIHAFGCHY
jgi:hypothetical protein